MRLDIILRHAATFFRHEPEIEQGRGIALVGCEPQPPHRFGVVLQRTGRDAEARTQHELALQVNRRVGDRLHEALTHANLGHIDLEAGRPDVALVASKRALALASRIGSSLLAAWLLAEIASAQQMRGNAQEAAILLGDTPYDIDAARRASVETVALLTGGWDADALQGAVAIYEDPEDVLRHFTASPFACVA